MARIALVGDSHMGSTGYAPALEAMLTAMGHIVVRRTQHDGWSTGRFVSSGELAQATAGADLAIVGLGGNDLQGEDKSKATYQAVLVEARRQISAPLVLWVGPSTALEEARGDTEDRHELAADFQRQIVPRLRGAAWIDSREFTDRWHREDAVHFTREGYAAWALEIARAAQWATLSPMVRAMHFGSYPLFRWSLQVGS